MMSFFTRLWKSNSFLVLAFFGCLINDRQPTELISGLTSYLTFQQVEKRLLIDSTMWEVVENTRLKDGDKRPQFNILSVKATYTDLGVEGTLVLNFYNDRLVETWFYPNDKDKYLNNMYVKYKIKFNSNSEKKVNLHTLLKMGTNFEGRFYVAWIDKKLSDDRNSWIKKYS